MQGGIIVNNTSFPRYGDIFSADLGGDFGIRPVIIVSNNKGNAHSPNVTVVPVTKQLKHIWQPTHTVLTATDNNLQYDSMTLSESILTIPKTSLRCFIRHLDNEATSRVSETVLLATGALAHIGGDALLALVEADRKLNS